jgi:hypothetical protein
LVILVLADHKLKTTDEEEEKSAPVFSQIERKHFIKREQKVTVVLGKSE